MNKAMLGGGSNSLEGPAREREIAEIDAVIAENFYRPLGPGEEHDAPGGDHDRAERTLQGGVSRMREGGVFPAYSAEPGMLDHEASARRPRSGGLSESRQCWLMAGLMLADKNGQGLEEPAGRRRSRLASEPARAGQVAERPGPTPEAERDRRVPVVPQEVNRRTLAEAGAARAESLADGESREGRGLNPRGMQDGRSGSIPRVRPGRSGVCFADLLGGVLSNRRCSLLRRAGRKPFRGRQPRHLRG